MMHNHNQMLKSPGVPLLSLFFPRLLIISSFLNSLSLAASGTSASSVFQSSSSCVHNLWLYLYYQCLTIVYFVF